MKNTIFATIILATPIFAACEEEQKQQFTTQNLNLYGK